MFVILVVPKLFQNFFCFFIRNLRYVNPLLFNLRLNVFKNVRGYLRGLFGLKLCQDFTKVIDAFISIKTDFFRWFLVRRLFIFNQVLELTGTQRIVTNHNPIIIYRDQFTATTFFTNRRIVNVFFRRNIRIINVFQVVKCVVRHGLRVRQGIYFEKLVQQFNGRFFFRNSLFFFKVGKEMVPII